MRYGEHCVPNWSWQVDTGSHLGYTIWGCWGGTGELKIGNHSYPVSSGDIFFLDYKEPVSGIQGDSWLQIRYIDFNVLPVEVNGIHKVMTSPKFMGSLFSKLKNNTASEEKELWLRAILFEFNSLKEKLSKENELMKNISALHELIEERPELPVSIKEFSKSLYYSADHFIREYRKLYGISPYQERQKIRYEKARSLLCHSSFPVSEISEICGFDSPNSFSKFFRKYSGSSPLEFRKNAN